MRGIGQDLWKRRVPHLIGVYLGISWGVLEFVGFLVNQYLLSTHLVTLCLVVMASLIPSVMVVAYFHGAPGRQGWTKVERVTVPANLIGLAVLLSIMFTGKDLGAATTSVTVTDEEGVETERVIPKSEFRTRIALFYFDADPADTAAAWLRYGVPSAVATDLAQNHFLDLRSAPLFADRLREAGFEELVDVPLSLQREIAEDLHRSHFVAGTVSTAGGEISATVSLYDARRGGLLEERTFDGEDVFALADEISLQLRQDLGVPELGGEEDQDLPVSELLTDSPEAYRCYVEASEGIYVRRDFAGAAIPIEEAIAIDPTFADAQYSLAQVYYLTNRTEEAVAPLQAAMEHIYRFPERSRFQVKSDYYFLVRQDAVRAMASIEMWADLFPDDIAAYQARAQIQMVRNDKPGWLASLQKILELDPAQRDVLLQIGDLQQAMGDLAAARESFRTYADEFPDNTQVLAQLAGVARLTGELEEARALYDRALLLDPSDVGLMVGMGNAERSLGRFGEALQQFDMALAAAATPEERAQVQKALESYYESRGQLERATEHLEQRLAAQSSFLPELYAVLVRMSAADAYVEAGREAEAFAMVEEVRRQVQPPFDAMAALGKLRIHLARDDADAVEAALPAVEAMLASLGFENLRPALVHARGRMLELRGEHREAIEAYEEERRLSPADMTIPRRLGRCYRELGEYDHALTLIQEALRVSPYDPRTNYEIALTFDAMGLTDDARTHLHRALEVWTEADEGYQPAARAREALASLGG
ncbi:MAG: tetratricopeptide repeat protein [Gemmatimonadota bacterium]|jgi:tetratricopeptide (TPR) repeat protein